MKVPALFTLALLSTLCVDAQTTTGYAPVNGLRMYYEIHGTGNGSVPLVLIHGGGSTITTSFGLVLPLLAKDREVVAVELQGHGHTANIARPETFEQDADDVAALLRFLRIPQADLLGFSNGGSTALQIAIRHPDQVRKVVAASAMFKRDGMQPWFWDFMKNASLENMPQALKDAYRAVAPNPDDLIAMHNNDARRMQAFTDWPDASLRSINAPVFVIVGDQDVVRPEHALEMYHLIPHARLAVLPGKHGEYLGEVTVATPGSDLPACTVSMIRSFLDEPMPAAGSGNGDHGGEQ